MALGNNGCTKLKQLHLNSSDFDVVGDERLGVIRRTGAMGKKRILVSNYKLLHDSSYRTPLKKPYGTRLNSKRSRMEALPQDILVRILCGVHHEDLDQLVHVSKSLQEAALIAKHWHFAFRTPSTKTTGLRPLSDLEEANKFDNHEAPNAPKQERRYKSARMSGKKLADITIALFHSPGEEQSVRGRLFKGREI